MFEMVADDPDRYIAMPTVTYEDRMSLHYGDTEVQLLYYGPAHTFGDTLVYFPESKTLFAGDIAFFYAMPFAAAGKVSGWLQVLDRVKELDIELIVPGHGPVGGKQELEDEREYFEFVMEQARRYFGEGLPVERAAEEIDLGAYADWPESERFIANLAVAYRDISEEI
jgi:cyclase